MPMFSRPTFLGASVRNYQCSIGWNGAPSTLTVNLVEDPTNGDLFSPVDPEQPIYFQYGNHRFFGLLEKWEKTRDQNGFPTYSVNCTDPRRLLENTKLIIGGYYGTTGNVRNLLNVFGLYENSSFGSSLTNDTGMPWRKIRDGIITLVNLPIYGLYGGPITHKGYAYSINLSQLPTLPDYFRIGGGSTNISLLQFIEEICQAAGYDFFVELIGFTIVIRTVSRYSQPPLGTITNLVENSTFSANVVRSSAGLEARNEVNATFLVGGDYTTLYKTDSISSFWGFNIYGEPIVGQPGYMFFASGSTSSDIFHAEPTEYMDLNAAQLSDIVFNGLYRCSTIEMRLAIASQNKDNWQNFVYKFRPDIASQIDLVSTLNLNENNNARIPVDLLNANRQNLMNAYRSSITVDANNKWMRLYKFVRQHAENFLGKKYVARLPFVLYHTDTETGKKNFSYNVVDAADNSEANDLNNLPSVYRDIFQTTDGRYNSFCYNFYAPSGIDIQRINTQNAIIDGNNIYSKVNVDDKIFFIPEPAVIFETTSPLFAPGQGLWGNHNTYSAMLHATQQGAIANPPAGIIDVGIQAGRALISRLNSNAAAGTVGLSIHPREIAPQYVHIPLQSTILKYGPWYYEGTTGNVHFEQDSSLVPWNYGSTSLMNLAAAAKIQNMVTQMQVTETGFIEVAGEPQYSLGDTLDANGPNLTDISVSMGENGVTTTYRFSTFVPRFGQLGKYNIDRMRRLNQISQQYYRDNNSKIRYNLYLSKRAQIGQASAAAYLASFPQPLRRESPNPAIIAHGTLDTGTGASSGNYVRYGVSSVTNEEGMFLLNVSDDDLYKNDFMVGWDTLFVPVSIFGDTDYSSRMYMPTIGSVWANSGIISSKTYNPWPSSSVGFSTNLMTFGDTYSDFKIGLPEEKSKMNNEEMRRVMALRGPVIVNSWGYDIHGSLIPAGFHSQMNRPDLWKSGPLDIRWADHRNVWTVHDNFKGKTNSIIPAKGSGTISIYVGPGDGTDSGLDLVVYNWFQTEVSANTRVLCCYVADDGLTYIQSADCG